MRHWSGKGAWAEPHNDIPPLVMKQKSFFFVVVCLLLLCFSMFILLLLCCVLLYYIACIMTAARRRRREEVLALLIVLLVVCTAVVLHLVVSFIYLFLFPFLLAPLCAVFWWIDCSSHQQPAKLRYTMQCFTKLYRGAHHKLYV